MVDDSFLATRLKHQERTHVDGIRPNHFCNVITYYSTYSYGISKHVTNIIMQYRVNILLIDTGNWWSETHVIMVAFRMIRHMKD